jgi:hypothetical protein
MSKLTFLAAREIALKSAYVWADRFTEYGPSNTVGVHVIERIKEKLDEAYEKGFADGETKSTPKKMRAHRSVRDSGFSRSRKK